MKKAPKIISIIFAIVLSFVMVACEGEAMTEAAKADLVFKVVKSDLSSGVLKIESKGQDVGYEVNMAISSVSGGRDFDAYMLMYDVEENLSKQNKVATGLFLRGDDLYVTKFDKETAFRNGTSDYITTVSSSDYQTEIDNMLENERATFNACASMTEIYSFLGNVVGFFVGADDYFADSASNLPDMLLSFLKNEGVLERADATIVYNGYRLSVDIIESIKKSIDDLKNIGTIIDEDSTMTLDGLYDSKEFQNLFKKTLLSMSATTIEDFLNFVVYKSTDAEEYSNLSLTVMSAKRGENGFDYLKRYFTEKINGVTIGSLRITDLAEMLGKTDATSFEKLFTDVGTKLYDGVKKFVDAFRIVYSYDEDMNLTRIYVDFNLKASDFTSVSIITYDNAHVKISYEPQALSNPLKEIVNTEN